MTGAEAARKLAKARDLTRRALANYAKVMRSESHGKTAREALDRYHRQSEEADRLFDEVAAHLSGD